MPGAPNLKEPAELPVERMFLEKMFLDNLPLIEELVDFVCRRSHFSPEDAEDFHQEVLLKLVENDYRVLRERVGSSLRGYLKVVILRAGQDYRNRIWGKFRERAEAKRLGEPAITLERLMVLGGLTFEEAKATLRTNAKLDLSDEDFDAIRVRLPPKLRRQFLPVEHLIGVPTPDLNPEEALEKKGAALKRKEILERLEQAAAELPENQCLLLRLHFGEGLKISDIARIRGVLAKPLYVEKAQALAALRRRLEREGLPDLEEVFRHLEGPDGPDGPNEVN